MKRTLALLLVAVMALGFVSCGKTAGGEVPTLVWYLPCNKQADTALVCEEINKIIEPKIGAKVDIRYITLSDFTERLRLIMASQEEFDLCFTGFTNPYLDGVRRDGFLEITDLVEKYAKEFSKTIPDYIWEAAEVDGEIYAVPCYQAMTRKGAIYFNKELVDKYGFDTSTVKKLEDVRPFLELIRDNEKGNKFPINRPDPTYFFDDIFRYQETSINYVYLDGETNEVVFKYDIPELKRSYEILKDWNDSGFFNPDVAAITGTNSCACWYTIAHRPGEVVDRERQYNMDIEVVELTDYVMVRSTATTTMTAISATSKHPEKAMQLILELNTNPEVFNLCAYGIEGKHYEKIDDSTIKLISKSGYTPEGNWKYGNMFIGYKLEGYEDNIWDAIQEANDISKKDVLLGFAADVTPVATYISNIATVEGEFKELEYGTSLDIEATLAKRDEKLASAGKEELLKYSKEQIYAYMDKNGLR